MYRLKMEFFFILLILLLAVGLSRSMAQEIPVLKDIDVKPEVTFDPVAGRYHYFYTLTNPPDNTGQITSFDISIALPSGGKEFNPEGYVIELGETFEGVKKSSTFIRQLSPLLKRPVVPVGADVPKGWMAVISEGGALGWGSTEKTYRIMPGQSLGGG